MENETEYSYVPQLLHNIPEPPREESEVLRSETLDSIARVMFRTEVDNPLHRHIVDVLDYYDCPQAYAISIADLDLKVPLLFTDLPCTGRKVIDFPRR